MDRPPPKHCKAPPPLYLRKRNLTCEERRFIVSRLLLSVKPDSPDFKLGRRIITSTASCYHMSWITIKKVWQCALTNFRNPAIQTPKIDVKPAVKRLLCLAASCCSCFGNMHSFHLEWREIWHLTETSGHSKRAKQEVYVAL